MKLKLPPPHELERRSRLVAFVDTLLEPEFDRRYYEFYSDWSVASGERVLGMRDGAGDHFFLWFGPEGVVARGCDQRKRRVAHAVLFEGLPPTLIVARDEAAFCGGGDTFALWWSEGATEWTSAVDPGRGGAGALLEILDGKPATFAKWAAAYHEVELDKKSLRALYDGAPITKALIERLGGTTKLDVVAAFELAAKLGLETEGLAPTTNPEEDAIPDAARDGAKKNVAIDDDAPRLGDAEFKVIRLDGETMLVVGGKAQLQSKAPDLYKAILEAVRAMIRAQA